jgi:hypothetical protein
MGVAPTARETLRIGARALPARIGRLNQLFKTTLIDTFGRALQRSAHMPLRFPLQSLTRQFQIFCFMGFFCQLSMTCYAQGLIQSVRGNGVNASLFVEGARVYFHRRDTETLTR